MTTQSSVLLMLIENIINFLNIESYKYSAECKLSNGNYMILVNAHMALVSRYWAS